MSLMHRWVLSSHAASSPCTQEFREQQQKDEPAAKRIKSAAGTPAAAKGTKSTAATPKSTAGTSSKPLKPSGAVAGAGISKPSPKETLETLTAALGAVTAAGAQAPHLVESINLIGAEIGAGFKVNTATNTLSLCVPSQHASTSLVGGHRQHRDGEGAAAGQGSRCSHGQAAEGQGGECHVPSLVGCL